MSFINVDRKRAIRDNFEAIKNMDRPANRTKKTYVDECLERELTWSTQQIKDRDTIHELARRLKRAIEYLRGEGHDDIADELEAMPEDPCG